MLRLLKAYTKQWKRRGAQKALAQYQQLIPYANEYLRHRDDEAFLANKNGQVQQIANSSAATCRNSLGGIRQS